VPVDRDAEAPTIETVVQLLRVLIQKQDTPPVLTVTVDEAARMLGIGRVLLYDLLNSGAIRSMVVGARARRIPLDALIEYISELSGETQREVSVAPSRNARRINARRRQAPRKKAG
jgi:excisionase family DNA binding protein